MATQNTYEAGGLLDFYCYLPVSHCIFETSAALSQRFAACSNVLGCLAGCAGGFGEQREYSRKNTKSHSRVQQITGLPVVLHYGQSCVPNWICILDKAQAMNNKESTIKCECNVKCESSKSMAE